MSLWLLIGCGPKLQEAPAPDDWTVTGPGGPQVAFDQADLGQACATLLGDEALESQHHNLVVMHDGYLLMPWAPEDGGGGLSWFDLSDPCQPVKVGEAYAEAMRESHTLAFGWVQGREYLAVDAIFEDGDRGGIGIWDVTDITDAQWVAELDLPGFRYPEAYFWVSLSTFWQGDRLYVSAGLLGTFVVDVSDPLDPVLIEQFPTVIPQVVGSLHVLGNVALSSSAGTAKTVLYDLSEPGVLAPLGGGEFDTHDAEGALQPYYFANWGGKYGLFARKANGGGPIVYDLSDPTEPQWVGHVTAWEGDGGYVFRHQDLLFQGESAFASIYDFSDPSDMVELFRFDLPGDLDTITPIGNVAVLSVDSGAENDQPTVVVPWDSQPDSRGPRLELTNPVDGAIAVPITGRIGLSFDELLEPRSVHAGSVRVWDGEGNLVAGRFNVQESLVNFTPDMELVADTTYFVEVPSGGVADSTLNATLETVQFSFTTGSELAEWPRR
jgi:hypothetical protein